MTIGGNLTLLKSLIYRLKRDFGCPIAVYQQSSETIDLITGRASVTKISVEIKRAIVLPSSIQRSTGFFPANGNFQYGGVLTTGQRQIIIDRKDLPKNFTIDASDKYYIIFDNTRYEIKQVDEFEFKLAYFILGSKVEGAIPNAIHNTQLRDTLCFNETLSEISPQIQLIHNLDTLTFSELLQFRMIRSEVLTQTVGFREVNHVL